MGGNRLSILGGDARVNAAAEKAVARKAVPAGPSEEKRKVAIAELSWIDRIARRSSALGGRRPRAAPNPNWIGEITRFGSGGPAEFKAI